MLVVNVLLFIKHWKHFTSLTAGTHVDNQVERLKISLSLASGIVSRYWYLLTWTRSYR